MVMLPVSVVMVHSADDTPHFLLRLLRARLPGLGRPNHDLHQYD